ncbi:hypothetical protein M5689_019685 [Euphorbia peplus]|nr:hypothetical protein M5689_019685 [Euphorbia peplus]
MSTIDHSLLAAINSEYGVDNSDVEIETTDDEDKSGGVTKSTESDSKRKLMGIVTFSFIVLFMGFLLEVKKLRSLRNQMRMKNMCLFVNVEIIVSY